MEDEAEEVRVRGALLGCEEVMLFERDAGVLIDPLAGFVDDFRPVLDSDMDVVKGFCNNSGDMTF